MPSEYVEGLVRGVKDLIGNNEPRQNKPHQELNVPFHGIANTNFCTEASIQMIADYYCISKTQDEIHEHAPYFEHPNILPYINEMTGEKYTLETYPKSDGIINLLDKGSPVMARIDGTHTVVIVGYNRNDYMYHDPDVGESQRANIHEFTNKLTGIIYTLSKKPEEDRRNGTILEKLSPEARKRLEKATKKWKIKYVDSMIKQHQAFS